MDVVGLCDTKVLQVVITTNGNKHKRIVHYEAHLREVPVSVVSAIWES